MKGREAVLAFMRDYLEMPRDADVEIGAGHAAKAPDELLVTVKVSAPHHAVLVLALPPHAARTFADLCEQTLHRHPQSELENLILGLRHGANVIDKAAAP